MNADEYIDRLWVAHRDAADGKPIVFKRSRSKIFIVTVGAALFSLMCFALVTGRVGPQIAPNSFKAFVLWLGVPFFAFATLMGLRLLLRNDPPPLELSGEGVLYRPVTSTLVSWQDIADISVQTAHGLPVVRLTLKSGVRQSLDPGRSAWGRSRLAKSDSIDIVPTGLDRSFEELAETMGRFYGRAKRSAGEGLSESIVAGRSQSQ